MPRDASHRFERGVDPDGTVYALQRAPALMADLGDAAIAKDIIDACPEPVVPVCIELDPVAVNIRLGTDLSVQEVSGFWNQWKLDSSWLETAA